MKTKLEQTQATACRMMEEACKYKDEVEILHAALRKATILARGCPPLNANIETCKLMSQYEHDNNCTDCWCQYLIEWAKEGREHVTGYKHPLALENERLRAELREIKALVRQGITPKFPEAESDE